MRSDHSKGTPKHVHIRSSEIQIDSTNYRANYKGYVP